MKAKCPSCNCSIEIADVEGEFICPACGEILVSVASGGAFSIRTLAEEPDSYESIAREWEKAVDAGEYERAERLRREMERVMGETSEEEEFEVVEDEEGGMEAFLVKREYDEDDEDFGKEEDDEFEEDFGEEEDDDFDEGFGEEEEF